MDLESGWGGSREIIDTSIACPVFWVHIEAPEYEQADDAEESLVRKFQRKVFRQETPDDEQPDYEQSEVKKGKRRAL